MTSMIALKSLWPLIKESVSQWSDDYAPSMGAALAYYTIFSIAPLLIIAIAVAGFFFGADAARGEIFSQLRGLIGDEGAAAIQGLVKSASSTGTGTFAAIAGVVTLLIGATTVFGELQSDLDRIGNQGAAARPAPFVRHDSRRRFPAARIPCALRRTGSAGEVLGQLVRRLGVRAAGREFRRQLRDHHRPLRDDLQAPPALPDRMEGRLDRLDGDVAAVRDWQALDRPLPRQERRRIGVRRCRVARHRAAVGLLFVADLPARCRIHEDLRAQPWQPRRPADPEDVIAAQRRANHRAWRRSERRRRTEAW